MNSLPATATEHERLIRKLASIAVLTAAERDALAGLPLRLRSIPENTDLVHEGETPSECCLIVEGFVGRYKLLGQGQRQIMSFHIPGDIPDLHTLQIRVMDHSLGALAPCRVAYIPHAALTDLVRTHPGLCTALWRDTLVDAAILREWLANIGRRNAHQRLAHLYCEIYMRLHAVGLAEGRRFVFPVTQAELGDAQGLSTVHINRVLQDIRRDGLIASDGTETVISDWLRLQAAGDFEPEYLHLRPDAGAEFHTRSAISARVVVGRASPTLT